MIFPIFGRRARYLFVCWLAVAGALPAFAQPVVLVRNPYRNALTALRPTNVALTFTQAMSPAFDQNVRVFSAQRGGRKAGTYATVGNTITFNPATDFRPGEVVSVTVPATVRSLTNVAAVKHVYQFTAAATGGSGYFVPPAFGADLPANTAPLDVAAGDVDNDGDVDMVVLGLNSGVQVRLNNGAGLFTLGSTVIIGTNLEELALGDVDADGDLDLVVVGGVNTVTIRLNNGAGLFSGGSSVLVGDEANDVALGDVDADGDLDLVTADNADATVTLRLNNGAGTFSGGGTTSVGSFPEGVALADVDNDGDLDLLAANEADDNVSVRLNNGVGTFSGGSTVSVGNQPQAISVGDLDGDGDLDLLTVGGPPSALSVRFNNGSGAFSPPAVNPNPALGTASGRVALGDVDGDGDLDVVVSGGAGTTLIRLNDGSGNLLASPATPDLAIAGTPLGVALADVDGDGDLDFFTANLFGNTVSVRLNESAFVVSSLNPARHTIAAARATNVAITFNKNVDNASASDLRVYGAQASGRKAGSRSAAGTTLTFNPTTDFKPGERIDVTVPATVETTGGQLLSRPHVYQLTAATTGGSGFFVPRPNLTLSSGPQDVTTGDVDGDGDLDILTVLNQLDAVAIRRNNGNDTYAAATVSVGNSPQELALADLNGDGDLDLLTANPSGNSVSIRFNNGSGAFSGGANLTVGTARGLALGDLDGDGDLDLLVTGAVPASLRIYANDGSGFFSPATGFAAGARESVALADLDNDGDLDVLGGSYAANNVAIYSNTGNMTFAAQGTVSVGANPLHVLAADMDGDGDQDLLTANFGGGSVSVRRNNGAGTFVVAPSVSFAAQLTDAQVGDVDSDGDLDLVAITAVGSAYHVALNNGVGAFTAAPGGAFAASADALDLADLDGDGDLDLVAAIFSDQLVAVRMNEAPFVVTAVSPARNSPAGPRAANVALTFSGAVNAATAAQTRVFGAQVEGRKAITGAGAGNTLTLDPQTDFQPGERVSVTVPAGVESALGQSVVPHVYQFTAAATGGLGTFTSAPSFGAAGLSPVEGTLVELNGDGNLDLVVANTGSANLQVWPGQGTGSFGASTLLPLSANPRRLVAGDINGDGDLDLLVPTVNNTVSVLSNNGTGTFAAEVSVPVGDAPGDMALADVDGDGDLDLLTANAGDDHVSLRLNNGSGTFSGGAELPAGDLPHYVTATDVDNDGDLDVLVSNFPSDNVRVLRNNGAGSFSAGAVITTGDGPNAITTGDIDGDGDADLLIINTLANTLNVRLNNGAGTFSNGMTLPVDALANRLALADIDGDGDLDLLIAGASMVLRRNNGVGTFGAPATVATGTFYGISAGDVDNDGDLDFVGTEDNDQMIVRLNQDAFLVTAVAPARNDADAPRGANVDVTFNKNVNATTANRIRVWGQQRGGKKVGVTSTAANVVSFNPTSNFAPGELVNVTVPTTVLSSGGEVARRHVYQYRAAVTGGQGTFTSAPNVADGSSGIDAIVAADVNGDGNLDLLDHQSNEVLLQLGNGDGTFGPDITVSSVSQSYHIATADLDNDSDLDLLVTDHVNNRVLVQLNNGTGTFGAPTLVSVSASPLVIATGDVDGDGDLDFVTTGTGGASVRFNNGSGNFSGAGNGGLIGGRGLALGDLDDDGDLDAVTASGSTATIRFNNGSGQFGGGYTVNVGVVPATAQADGALLGDLDGDGDLDLVVNNSTENILAIRLNDGAGQLGGALNVPAGPDAVDAAMGDVDGDGDLDLLVANEQNGTSRLLLNNGNATFVVGTPVTTITASVVALGDLDNDGDLDVMASNDDGGFISVRLNDNAFTVTARAPERHTNTTPVFGDVSLTLSETIKATTAAQLRVFGSQSSGRKGGVFAGVGTSLTLDPNVDFAPGEVVSVTARATILSNVGNKPLRPQVYQFRAAATGGSGTFINAPDVSAPNGGQEIAVGDVNGDGDLDLISGDFSASVVRIRLGDGAGGFGPATTEGFAPGVSALALADLDADGDLDLLMPAANFAGVGVRLNNGSGGFGGGGTLVLGDTPAAIATGDVDGDGDVDFVTANYADNSVSVVRNQGGGLFSVPVTFAVADGPADAALADVDLDGDLDLLVAVRFANVVRVFRNDGAGAFVAPADVAVANGPFSIAVADMDGDGDADLLTGSVAGIGGATLSRNDGTGAFGPSTPVNVGGKPFGLRVADVDGDGDLDLAAILNDLNQVSIRLNLGAGTFSTLADVPVDNSPTDLATGDLDGDGDLDLLVGAAAAQLVNVRLNADQAGPAPTILSFTPDHGVTGTVVTITGTNFTGTTAVTFDGVIAPGFVVNGAGTEITVNSPPATFNGVIAVTTSDGVASTATDFGVDLVISAAENIPAGDFHHITVTATGVAALSGPVEATAPVLVQAGGQLTTAAHVLSGAGDFTLEAGATLAVGHPLGLGAAGAIQLTGGLSLNVGADYAFDGAAAQVTGSNVPAEVRNLTINNPADVSLTQGVNIRQVLTLGGAGDFTLNGQSLTLLSDAAGTALVANTGAGRVVGNATAQVWISSALNAGLDYRHLASPTANSTVADLATPGFVPVVNPTYNTADTPLNVKPYPSVYGFDEARLPGAPAFISGYYSPAALTDVLGVGVGYTAYIKGGLTPDFRGALTQDDVTRANLTRTGAGVKAGWHLIGNPYPSPLDWDQVSVPAGLNPSISVYRSTGVNTGTYLTRANGLGTLPDGVVPMGQAFFARVDVAPVSLTFTNACRVTTFGTAAHYRAGPDARPAAHLSLRAVGASAAETDGTVVYFEDGATPAVDRGFDGARPAHNVGLPTLVSLTATGEELAVNGLPTAALVAGTTVELLLDLPTAGTYELAVARVSNLAGVEAVLLDRLTGTRYVLTEQPMATVTTQAAELLRGRFALVFGSGARSASDTAGRLQLYPNPARGDVRVTGVAPGAPVTVLDATGRVVLTCAADASGATVLPGAKLAPGVYVVRGGITPDQRGAQVQRLVIE